MVKQIKVAIKFFITFSLLYFVFSKIDYNSLIDTIKNANYFYLFLAFLAFNISKIISAFRLNYYLKEIKIDIDFKTNLELYYLGMFYNLFLPGGIGGDGYKAYLFNKHYDVKLKQIIEALLFDRLSGLVGLVLIASFLFLFSDFNIYPYNLLDIVLFLLVVPLFYLFSRYFNKFLYFFKHTLVFGILVQIFQLISAYFIVLALNQTYVIDFLVLFFISSILAVLPITIGGVGIREITFLYGLEYLHLDSKAGVAFGILFFFITLISSLIGVVYINKEFKFK